MSTHIQWSDETWNPIAGCSKVSAGCTHCYALRDATRLAGNPNPKIRDKYAPTVDDGKWTGQITFDETALDKPLHWRTPRTIFVNSMSDLFHENVADAWIERIFHAMDLAHWHRYIVLTKRPKRMAEWVVGVTTQPNVWLGTSVENQDSADERLPYLASISVGGWHTLVSAEPLLGPVGLDHAPDHWLGLTGTYPSTGTTLQIDPAINWVIVGGESGPDSRSCDVDWLRSIVRQCRAANVPCFLKQLGSNYCDAPNGVYGHGTQWPYDMLPAGPFYRLRDRKGGNPDEWPEYLRVRQTPWDQES